MLCRMPTGRLCAAHRMWFVATCTRVASAVNIAMLHCRRHLRRALAAVRSACGNKPGTLIRSSPWSHQNLIHAHIHTQTHRQTHTHTRTHARTHARTRARAHRNAHTHRLAQTRARAGTLMRAEAVQTLPHATANTQRAFTVAYSIGHCAAEAVRALRIAPLERAGSSDAPKPAITTPQQQLDQAAAPHASAGSTPPYVPELGGARAHAHVPGGSAEERPSLHSSYSSLTSQPCPCPPFPPFLPSRPPARPPYAERSFIASARERPSHCRIAQ